MSSLLLEDVFRLREIYNLVADMDSILSLAISEFSNLQDFYDKYTFTALSVRTGCNSQKVKTYV